MDIVAARSLGSRPGLPDRCNLAPYSVGAVSRFLLRDGSLTALDGELRPRARRALKRAKGLWLLAATDDLSQFVARRDDRAEFGSTALRRLDIPKPDSATFVGPDRVIISAPTIERRAWDGRSYDAATTHNLHLIDTTSGAFVDSITLDTNAAGLLPVVHPGGSSIVFDAGEGQDGNHLFLTTWAGDRLAATKFDENITAADFNPGGTRLLQLPHPSFAGEARVITWPAREIIGSLRAEDVRLDAIDFYGCWLEDDLVLLKTLEQGLLLTDGALAPRARVRLGDRPQLDYELDELFATSPRTFATVGRPHGEPITEVWRLDDPA